MKNKKVFFSLLKCAGAIIGGWCTALQVLPLMGILTPAFMINIVTMALVVVAITFCYFSYLVFHTILREYHVGTGAKRISIRFGNILKVKNASILIGVNDDLSCDPHRIGENSIHHKLMSLKENAYLEHRFTDERKKLTDKGIAKADYGYTFASSKSTSGMHYLFLVMSTIQAPNNIRTSPEKLGKAITAFFDSENELQMKNACVHMPIIGSGPAGVNMRKEDIVKLIACEFINHTFTEPCYQMKRLVIQIRWKDILDISIMEIVNAIAWMTANCCCLDTKLTQREVEAA